MVMVAIAGRKAPKLRAGDNLWLSPAVRKLIDIEFLAVS
jgi:hypothetical protein